MKLLNFLCSIRYYSLKKKQLQCTQSNSCRLKLNYSFKKYWLKIKNWSIISYTSILNFQNIQISVIKYKIFRFFSINFILLSFWVSSAKKFVQFNSFTYHHRFYSKIFRLSSFCTTDIFTKRFFLIANVKYH